MKKVLTMALMLSSFNALSFDIKQNLDKYMSRSTQKNIVPCALAVAAPMLLGSNDFLPIGASVCAATIGVNYLNNDLTLEDEVDFKDQMTSFMKNAKKDIKENFEQSKRNYAYYQEIIRDTVGQKFAEFDSDIEQSIKDYMDSDYFQQQLKRKLRSAGKDLKLSEREKKLLREEVAIEVIRKLTE